MNLAPRGEGRISLRYLFCRSPTTPATNHRHCPNRIQHLIVHEKAKLFQNLFQRVIACLTFLHSVLFIQISLSAHNHLIVDEKAKYLQRCFQIVSTFPPPELPVHLPMKPLNYCWSISSSPTFKENRFISPNIKQKQSQSMNISKYNRRRWFAMKIEIKRREPHVRDLVEILLNFANLGKILDKYLKIRCQKSQTVLPK